MKIQNQKKEGGRHFRLPYLCKRDVRADAGQERDSGRAGTGTAASLPHPPRIPTAIREENRTGIRVLAVTLLVLAVVLVLITMLFNRTKHELEEKYKETVRFSAERISGDIDEMVGNIYSVSDVFAQDASIQDYYDKDYSHYGLAAHTMKLYDMMRMRKQIFPSYSVLKANEQVSAIYNHNGVLYNFLDVNNDGPEVTEQIDALGANRRENLAKLVWYPLMGNFLSQTHYGNVREDSIVLGTRRIYSWEKREYVAIHLFAIREADLYEMYKNELSKDGMEIYILNEDGGLLSASSEAAVAAGALDETFHEQLRGLKGQSERSGEATLEHNGKTCLVNVIVSPTSGWRTLMLTPLSSVTGTVNRLYLQIFSVFFTCIILLACMAVYILMSRISRIKERQTLEMDVLMAQINPHFLYNTLENIVWKANEAGRPDIGKLAASLGRLYRLSISGGVIIRMQQEIEHLMAYINIQKSRYGEKLNFELLTDYEVTQWLYVPKLILQPVVENAIHYGMDGIDHPLLVTLAIEIGEKEIQVIVEDNGAGMRPEQLEAVRRQIREGRAAVPPDEQPGRKRKGTGLGLRSVSERIRIYLGRENAVLVESREGEGTRVTISLPRLTQEDAVRYGYEGQ